MARVCITSPTELSVELDGGERFAIHPLWLRERCEDPGSMDQKTGQRLQDPSALPLSLGLSAVRALPADRYRVRFSDGHEADFSAATLLAEIALPPGNHDLPPVRHWDSRLGSPTPLRWRAAPPAAELAGWLAQFLRDGFILLHGVPRDPGTVLAVAAAFGFVRRTNFGELFDVRSVPQATDLAYTAVPLDAHTDNPYRDPVPGVQLLHCLVNETGGGLSTLVDGFAVAAALQAQDPEAFDVLSGTEVRFEYRDARTHLVASAVPIERDATGRVRAIHFSPRLDFVPLAPPQALARYYRARAAFDGLLRSESFEIRFRLNPGDLVMFDNRRLLHGRTGFDPAEGLRHLQGCYLDIDGPRSLFRVLRARLAAPAEARDRNVS